MEVEAISCPKCGAPISDEREKSLFLCVYCGSRVSVKESSGGKLTVSLGEAAADLMTEQAFLRTLEAQLVRLNGEKHQITRERDILISNLESVKPKKETSSSNFNFTSCSVVMAIGLLVGFIAWRSFDSFFAFIVVGFIAFIIAAVVGSAVGEANKPKPAPVIQVSQPSPEQERLQVLKQKETEINQKINLVHKNINDAKRNINNFSMSLANKRN